MLLFSCYNRMAQFSVSDPANGSRSVNGTLLKKQTNKQTTKQKQNREYFVLIIANTCEVDHLNLSKKLRQTFPQKLKSQNGKLLRTSRCSGISLLPHLPRNSAAAWRTPTVGFLSRRLRKPISIC